MRRHNKYRIPKKKTIGKVRVWSVINIFFLFYLSIHMVYRFHLIINIYDCLIPLVYPLSYQIYHHLIVNLEQKLKYQIERINGFLMFLLLGWWVIVYMPFGHILPMWLGNSFLYWLRFRFKIKIKKESMFWENLFENILYMVKRKQQGFKTCWFNKNLIQVNTIDAGNGI